MAKILIVDDSPQMTHLLAEMVGLFGHEAETAQSGAEGLKKIESFGPDLILLDIMMPGMDGWAFLEEARKRHLTPIMMISADESASTKEKARRQEVPLLPKAANPLLLQSKIDELVNSESATA